MKTAAEWLQEFRYDIVDQDDIRAIQRDAIKAAANEAFQNCNAECESGCNFGCEKIIKLLPLED